MKKNILILGGTRFIGYLLLLKLTNEGHKVAIYNRGITKTPGKLPKDTLITKGDRENQTNYQDLFKSKYDCVIDLSGFTEKHVRDIIQDYSDYIGHYIFISSTSVYKASQNQLINEESHTTDEKNSYGNNKRLAEEFLIKSKNRIPITIFRPSGVYGPYDPGLSGLIIYRLLNNLPILIKDNLSIETNKIFIGDLLNVIGLSLNNNKLFGNTYNIAGDSMSLDDFINICANVCKKKPIIKDDSFLSQNKYVNLIKIKRHVYFNTEWPINNTIFDNQKIKKILLYKFTDPAIAIKDTYNWLNEDKNRLEYFGLKYEHFVLNKIPLSLIKKFNLKIYHLSNNLILYLKRSKIIANFYRIIKKRI